MVSKDDVSDITARGSLFRLPRILQIQVVFVLSQKDIDSPWATDEFYLMCNYDFTIKTVPK